MFRGMYDLIVLSLLLAFAFYVATYAGMSEEEKACGFDCVLEVLK